MKAERSGFCLEGSRKKNGNRVKAYEVIWDRDRHKGKVRDTQRERERKKDKVEKR